jgi:hypothetical protein
MTSRSPIVTPQPGLPPAADAESSPAPTVRADTLFHDKTNHTPAAGTLSDPLAAAGQSRKPTTQLSSQSTSATPSPPDASSHTPHRR